MCGIAGFAGAGKEETLRAMIATIRYRGPDEQGYFLKNSVGLAHARLSIIDLSPTGRQPMTRQNGGVTIVFNGEIYNYLELKKQLQNTGKHVFVGTSDTEVILCGYKEWGEGVFARLQGMFAIALYDAAEHKLILARDRMGEKPLYWGVFGDTLVFGSELKAVLAHPVCQKKINVDAINQYLLLDYIPTPHTIWQNIFKLEPATYLVWQNGLAKKSVFWQTSFDTSSMTFSNALYQFDKLLDTSVRRMLVADVPVGIFLSGGIDSSTVAYYAQKNSSRPIKTFSIGFAEKTFDESVYARLVAQKLNTDHHDLVVTDRDAQAVIPDILKNLDEPLADASIIPTFILSRFTRQKVTVALGGDGSDELFGGYPTFKAERLVSGYRRLPSFMQAIIKKAVQSLPSTATYYSFEYKLKKFLAGVDSANTHRHAQWLGTFLDTERSKVLLPEALSGALKNPYRDVEAYFESVKEHDWFSQLLYIYQKTYLMDQVLVKVDRASMRHSLEVRAPFLDVSVVDFVNNLEYSLKSNWREPKHLLQQLMKDRLPQDIVFRAKKGFGVPMALWLRRELKPLCTDLLSPQLIKSNGLLDASYVATLQAEHFSGQKNNAKELWNLMVLSSWIQNQRA